MLGRFDFGVGFGYVAFGVNEVGDAMYALEGFTKQFLFAQGLVGLDGLGAFV